MIRLYKAYMNRFIKNIYFIGGCLIALAVTYAVTSNTMAVPFLADSDTAVRMFFVTAAMVAYFTVFIPVFTGIQPLQIAFGDFSVIRHAPPAFRMLVSIAARVNHIAVIRIV